MFGRLFGGGAEPRLAPLTQEHLRAVVEIIAETDEDDAAEAEEAITANGGAGMFVLLENRKVVGVTGAQPAEGAEGVAWLSWTYLAAACRGRGLGKQMIDMLLRELNNHEIRKIFIATSDCIEDGENIYAAAHRLYEEMGADEELRVPDYHGPGEAMLVYGMVNPTYDAPPAAEEDPPLGMVVESAERAPDSDRIAALHWRELEPGEDGPMVQGLAENMAEIRSGNARAVVVTLTSALSDLVAGALQAEGFRCVGSLTDYYAAGVDQVWWHAQT